MPNPEPLLRSAYKAFNARDVDAAISSNVEPLNFTRESDGSIVVDVHQVVRDAHTGELLSDANVRHCYRLEDDMIVWMDVMGVLEEQKKPQP